MDGGATGLINSEYRTLARNFECARWYLQKLFVPAWLFARIFVIVWPSVRTQGAAELNRAEPKAISKIVRGARQFLQFGTPLWVEQIQLRSPVCEATQTDTEKADFSFVVAMLPKEALHHCKDVGI